MNPIRSPSRITLEIEAERIVSPGFEPRSAGPEPTMMDRYTKRLAGSRKASHSSIKRFEISTT